MHVAAHHSPSELLRWQNRATRPTLVLKLRAVILAQEGWFAAAIAAALGKNARTIQQWVGDYNRQGFEGLRDRRTSNRRYLTTAQEEQLRAYLDAQANDPHAGVRYARELLPFIAQHFGVTYRLSGLYDLLHRLGYTGLMPRPRHEQNDPAVLAAFKKTRARSSNKSRPSIRTSGSKYGSRTKPASASKAR